MVSPNTEGPLYALFIDEAVEAPRVQVTFLALKATNTHPSGLGSWPWDHSSAILSPATGTDCYVTETLHASPPGLSVSVWPRGSVQLPQSLSGLSVFWAEGWWQEAMEVASEGGGPCPCGELSMGPPSCSSAPSHDFKPSMANALSAQ